MLSHLFSFTSRVTRATRLFSTTSRVSVQPNFSCPLFSTTSWDSPRDFNIFLFCCRGSTQVFAQKAQYPRPNCATNLHSVSPQTYFRSHLFSTTSPLCSSRRGPFLLLACLPSFFSCHILILISLWAMGGESSSRPRRADTPSRDLAGAKADLGRNNSSLAYHEPFVKQILGEEFPHFFLPFGLPDHGHAILLPPYLLTVSEVMKSLKLASTNLLGRCHRAQRECCGRDASSITLCEQSNFSLYNQERIYPLDTIGRQA